MIQLPRSAAPRRRVLAAAGIFFLLAGMFAVPAFAVDATGSDDDRLLVSLGDSFTSGIGTLPYEPGTEASMCFRSRSAYPIVAAEKLGISVKNVACSGATLAALTERFKGQAPQLAALPNADHVVLSLGGNDVRSLELLRSGAGQAEQFAEALVAAGPRFTAAYRSVVSAAPEAEVLVVGYPDFFPTDPAVLSSCAPQLARTASGTDLRAAIAAIHQAVGALNAVVKTSAQAAGAGFVDTTPAFRGHDFCADDAWAEGVSVEAVRTGAALHPNLAGHVAIGELVAAQLRASNTPVTSTTVRPTTTTTIPSDGLVDLPTSTMARPATSTTTVATGGLVDLPTSTTVQPTTSSTAPTRTTVRPTRTDVANGVLLDLPTSSTVRPTTTSSTVPPTTTTVPPTRTGGGSGLVDLPKSTPVQPHGESGRPATTNAVRPAPAPPAEPLTPASAPSSETPAEVLDLSVARENELDQEFLAETGANFEATISIGLAFTGTGLALIWLKWMRDDRALATVTR